MADTEQTELGPVQSERLSIGKLSEGKQKYLQGIAQGKSKYQSALDAGYSELTAKMAGSVIETPDVKTLFRAAIEEFAPYRKLAQRIAEGLDAEKTEFFAHKGEVVSQRNVIDYSERRKSAEIAAQMCDYWQPKVSQNGVFLVNAPPKSAMDELDAWAEDGEK